MTRRSPHIGFALVGPVIGFGWLVAVAGGGRPIGAAIDIIGLSAAPITLGALTVLGIVGLGWVIAMRALPGLAQTRPVALLTHFVIGATALSLALLALASLGVLDLAPFWLTRILLCVGGLVVAWQLWRSRRPIPVSWIDATTLAGFGAFTTFVLVGLTVAPAIHPDAAQYHVAIPRAFRLAGEAISLETLFNNGTALGSDLLFLVAADLGALTDNPSDTTAQLVAFTFFIGLVAFGAVFALARTLGSTQTGALLAMAALLSVSSIGRWGTMKNDVLAAGVAIVATTLAVDTIRRPTRPNLIAVGIALGYAVSVKVNSAAALSVIVIGLFVVLLRSQLKPLDKVMPFLVAAVVALPWVIRATVLTGSPLHPLITNMPDDVAARSAVRNANGLEFTPSNFIRTIPDLLLDRYEGLAVNDSVGLLFLAAFLVGGVVATVRIVTRRGTVAELVFAAGAVYLLVFSLYMFETRFLTRWVIFAFCTTFAYAAAIAPTLSAERVSESGRRAAAALCLVAIALSGWVTDLRHAASDRAQSDELAALGTGSLSPTELRAGQDAATAVDFYAAVDEVAAGGTVLINDQMFLYVDAPPVNAHSLHSGTWDWDTIDLDAFIDDLRERDVRAAVFRPGISGIESQLTDYLAECGEEFARHEGLIASSIIERCR